MFTTGVEVQTKYPFRFRATVDNLLKRLPQKLFDLLKPDFM